MEKALLIAALLTFLFGIFSKAADHSPITAPMVFATVGIVLSPVGLGVFQFPLNSELVKLLAEITLVMVLFVEASTITIRNLFKEYTLLLRLLFIGLPLTMVLGIVLAFALFPDYNHWVLAAMALILSPTDAALGQAVVNSPRVPNLAREAIVVESGLNDGISLPPILACIAAITGSKGYDLEVLYWAKFVFLQLVVGGCIGALVGWGGGKVISYVVKKQWINGMFVRLSSIALAAIAYSLAEWLHGNGFIAAFLGGVFFGTQIPHLRKMVYEFGEAEGQQLTLFVFLLFGLVLVPLAAPLWTWKALVYAICSLTVIRMLPVALSLIGTKLRWSTVLFIGWFGPRGMASILYLLMFVRMVGTGKYDEMLAVISLTVLISIFVHGLSAVPLAKIYGRNVTAKGGI